MRLTIDFSGRAQHISPVTVALLLAATLAATAAAYEYLAVREEYRVQAAALAHVRRASPPAAGALSARQVEAMNKAIRQLNLPWPALFASIENVLNERVALLALEPDAVRRILRIEGEAKSSDDMIDFVGALRNEAAFTSARLVRHEINENDRNKPYRFVLEAQWDARL